MSDVISKAVELLGKKVPSFDGVCKFVMPGEGSIMMDVNGVRAGDEDAEVTMTAKPEVFMAILTGDMNPTMAFMTGKLSVDGNMGMAMKVGATLS